MRGNGKVIGVNQGQNKDKKAMKTKEQYKEWLCDNQACYKCGEMGHFRKNYP